MLVQVMMQAMGDGGVRDVWLNIIMRLHDIFEYNFIWFFLHLLIV
jgi:hypothetical protein